ncbi:MAG: hypothetical protein Q4C47_05655 [Planctomycetia bacterium]|nr:hypothetical protein [Planctomycetia bacterium]
MRLTWEKSFCGTSEPDPMKICSGSGIAASLPSDTIYNNRFAVCCNCGVAIGISRRRGYGNVAGRDWCSVSATGWTRPL